MGADIVTSEFSKHAPPIPSYGATSSATYMTSTTPKDPYSYQVGFGNSFCSEAVPGTLPQSVNAPQRIKYDLYSEQLNGSPFVSSRNTLKHAWFYRIFPSAAHGPIAKTTFNPNIEAAFSPSNERVEFVPQALNWLPFPIPPTRGADVDFVAGLKTIAGYGDATTKEGVAVHVYTANVSMRNRAFCSSDGDMLIMPQLGRLDIQTEFGRMMVRPGELAVIQAGIRFMVRLPEGPVRGYIQEIFGSHYELPELGPLGSNGLALPRDFEHPVASFDLDTTEWEIVYKLAGKLWTCRQSHTPFDVVAWHGNYVPYKYAAEKFVNAAYVDKDQADPSLYTVLTAKSKTAGVSVTDVMVFTPKWAANTKAFRPPYYHRNMATEIVGIVYGDYKGTSRDLRAGGLSFQSSYMPHGESHEAWLKATSGDLKVERIGEGYLGFMLQISAHCAVTKFALERSGVLQPPPSTVWDSMKGHFFDHIDEVNSDLQRQGLKPLGSAPQNA